MIIFEALSRQHSALSTQTVEVLPDPQQKPVVANAECRRLSAEALKAES
jgi:hypothetical protein